MRIKVFKAFAGLLLLNTVLLGNVAYARDYNDALVFVGDTEFNTELALTPNEQRKGLMFRKSMADNQAMLFIYPQPRKVAFWMRNTLIPLDMLFFDGNGELVEIKENVPPCKTENCPTYPAQNPTIKYVLEINAGQSQLLDIKIGDKLYGCGI